MTTVPWGEGCKQDTSELQELSYADGIIPALTNDKLDKIEAKFVDRVNALEVEYRVQEFLQLRDKLVQKYARDSGSNPKGRRSAHGKADDRTHANTAGVRQTMVEVF